MKRTPLRRIGERKLRETPLEMAFKANPPKTCERCRRRRRVQAHHVLPRSRGGLHTPENRYWLCKRCHGMVHEASCADWRSWIQLNKPGAHHAQEEAEETEAEAQN